MGALEIGRVYCRNHVQQLNKIREQFEIQINALDKVKVVSTDGAFYLLLKVDTQLNDLALAKKLISDYKVAVVPGTAFGASAEGYIRISYASSMDNLKEAMQRMSKFLERLNAKSKKR